MNVVLVETWESLKLPPTTFTQEYFKNIHIPLEKVTNHQACLASTQTSNGQKSVEVESIVKAII